MKSARLPTDAALARLVPAAALERLRLVWNLPLPVLLQDGAFRIVAANAAFERFSGQAARALQGTDPVELQPEDDRMFALAWREAVRDGVEDAPHEGCIVGADGRVRGFRASMQRVDGRGTPLYLTVLQDTSAERAAAERADRVERELDHWFDLGPTGMVLYDDTGLLVRSNPAFEVLVGQAPVLLADAPAPVQELLGWQHGAPSAELVPGAPALERRGMVVLPDGRRLRLRAIVRAFESADGARRVLAAVEDRTLEDEHDLAQLEIGALMDTAGVGVATWDPSRGWLQSGRGRPRGGGGGAGAVQAISRELVEPDSLPDYERLQGALRHGERAEVRYAVRHPELGRRWLLTRVEPGELRGGRRAASVVTLDVTDQQLAHLRSEQLLRELATILDSTSAGIAYLRGPLLVRCNARFERMLGLPAGQAAGATLSELFERGSVVRALLHESLAALADTPVFETEFRAADGTWLSLSVRRVAEAEAVAVLTDISRLKSQQAELEGLLAERDRTRTQIAQQAERTRAILDSVLVGIVTVGDAGIAWMNRSARRMFGGELADFVGRAIDVVATDEPDHPLRRTHYLRALADGEAEAFECRLQARDGRVFWVAGNAVVTGDDRGARQVTFALLDIERRRQAEEARVEAAIAQRDRLVKEVHHRIKNNLQGVAGLMQQFAGRRPEVAPVIAEAVGQVQAIAQVYGLQVGNAGPLRVKSVLEAIVASVQRLVGREVRVEVSGVPHRWALPEAESIPIALTLNELLVNAHKHGDGKEVRCTLACGDAEVRIRIANGGRLPDGFDLAHVPGGVSGLGLVRALLPRRNATLTLAPEGGEVVATIVLVPPGVTLLEPL